MKRRGTEGDGFERCCGDRTRDGAHWECHLFPPACSLYGTPFHARSSSTGIKIDLLLSGQPICTPPEPSGLHLSLADSWRKGSKPAKSRIQPHLKLHFKIGEDSWHLDVVHRVTSMAFVAGVVEPFWRHHAPWKREGGSFPLGTLVFECDSWLALSSVKLDSDYSWAGHVHNFWILFLLRGDFFQGLFTLSMKHGDRSGDYL